jgi:hypothetical protein
MRHIQSRCKSINVSSEWKRILMNEFIAVFLVACKLKNSDRFDTDYMLNVVILIYRQSFVNVMDCRALSVQRLKNVFTFLKLQGDTHTKIDES